jgi:hypothetical protein
MLNRKIGIVALGVLLLTASVPRTARAADDNFTRNILIGALIGAAIGGIIGVIVYVSRDKPPAATTALAPPGFAAVGLGPLPLPSRVAPVDAGEVPPNRAVLLRF